MKLTTKLKAELRSVYDDFWNSLLTANTKKLALLFDDDFRQIGTTEAEVFFNKVSAIKFVKATADQIIGNIELRKRKIKIEPVEELILIIEQADVYVRIDTGWTFYSKGRFSSLLQ